MNAPIDVLAVLESVARSLWVEGKPVNPHAADLLAARAAVAELIEAAEELLNELRAVSDESGEEPYNNLRANAALARVKGGAA